MARTTTRLASSSFLGLVTGIVAASCAVETTYVREDHCATQTGDDWCATRYPDGSRPFCARGACGPTVEHTGCVEERPSDDECYSPCGGRMSFPEDASCLEGDESTGSSTSGSTDTGGTTEEGMTTTTGPMPCVGKEDCVDEAAQFCEPESGECVSCDALADQDGACAEEDPGLPLCVGGACVACSAEDASVCAGQGLVCDEESNACVPCTEHDQCGDAACNLFDGTCLPADAVVRVGAGLDHATLGDAVGSFPAGAEGTIIVHAGNYNEPVTIDGGRVVAFLINDGDLPEWTRTAGGDAPQLTVGDGTVLIDGLQLSGNDSTMDPAVLVDGGRAWVDRGRIIVNQGGGIVAQNAAAELVLRNCFVSGAQDVDAVTLDASSGLILYSTIGGGIGAFDMARAVTCLADADLEVRNSILVTLDDVPELDCSMATVSYSATETAVAGTENETLGPVQATWFTNYAAGDFHLETPPAVVVTAAQWEQGDPATDIDGQARPETDGAMDAAGADLP